MEELILTGSSAGGLATILNADRVASLVRPVRMAALADAGFFKYEQNHSTPAFSASGNFSADMQHVFGMVNASGVLSSQCQSAQATSPPHPGGKERPTSGPWNCLMAATAVPYVQSPLFILQSRFDHFQLGAELALTCMVEQAYHPPWKNVTCSASEVAAIRAYGQDLYAEVEAAMENFPPGSRRGLFLSSCIVHGQVCVAGNELVREIGVNVFCFERWHRFSNV